MLMLQLEILLLVLTVFTGDYFMEDKEDVNKAMYLDEQDFLAKFLFNPEIKDEANYSHIDKNLSMTRLASRWHEPERARSILDSLHIITNTRYFKDVVVEESTDEYDTVTIFEYQCPICKSTRYSEEEQDNIICCDNNIVPNPIEKAVPITRKLIKKLSLFPRSYHFLKAKFLSFVTTSSARDGHLIRSATTTNISKNESVEDRTRAKGNPFFGRPKNSYDRY